MRLLLVSLIKDCATDADLDAFISFTVLLDVTDVFCESAIDVDAEQPARVKITLAINTYFFIWRPYLSLVVSTGVVYCRSDIHY